MIDNGLALDESATIIFKVCFRKGGNYIYYNGHYKQMLTAIIVGYSLINVYNYIGYIVGIYPSNRRQTHLSRCEHS